MLITRVRTGIGVALVMRREGWVFGGKKGKKRGID